MRRRVRRRRMLLTVLALSLVLAGCGGNESSRPPTTATTSTPAPPSPAELCGAPTTPARSFWLPAPEGAQLQAAVVGTGPDTVVFVHESGPRGLCGFWPYADWLAKTRGVRSVLFSQCGNGASQCPTGDTAAQWLAATNAAVSWARAHGARQLTLVGASAGGIVALQVAAMGPQVDGVVNLSGERRWKGLDSLAAARRLQVPALFAVASAGAILRAAFSRRPYTSGPASPSRPSALRVTAI